jgi:hypothetical protein
VIAAYLGEDDKELAAVAEAVGADAAVVAGAAVGADA